MESLSLSPSRFLSLFISSQLEKVNSFYDEKLDELEHRFSLLQENVTVSLQQRDATAKSNEGGGGGTGDDLEKIEESKVLGNDNNNNNNTQQHHKTTSSLPHMTWQGLVDRLKRKHSSGSEGGGGGANNRALADVDDLYERDQESTSSIRDAASKVKKIAEADSIQRALVDQHRTAKLLHNFVIMNYTGFVKIVKKHDKTLNHRKGKFKKEIEPYNICNEGKLVEALASRLERRYAAWFCDGNIREAIAQLLPKRGDGLETDWSQLR